MALLKTGSYKNTGTVYLDYKLYAEELWGNGTNRAIRVTVEFKCGGNPSYPSWYGYACYWQAYVNSTYSGTGTMKGSESWNTNNGYRSYSMDITVNVGTTSATTVNVGFVTNSVGDDGWDGGANASFGVSSTNTAPDISGSVTADGTTGNKYIPENQNAIALSWPAASDANGNLSTYRVRVSVNGGGYTEIAKTNASTRSYTHDVSGYGSGTTFKYAVDCYDSMGAWSPGSAISGVITKNTLIRATLVAPASISYNTTSLSFSWSGANNQVSNSSFSYKLTCDNINLYDAFSTGNSITVAIVSSKPASGAYILKSDLVNHVSNNSYKGTLNFRLATTNTYGSTLSDVKSTSVNLQSPPATPAPVINTSDDSPDSLNIWRTAADTKSRYMIPNGVRRIRVSWPTIVGASGESITYDVFYRLDGGGYISLGNQPGTSYNLVLSAVQKLTTINFMVRAKSSYGLISGDGVSAGQNMHYYNFPTISYGGYTRTDSSATLKILVKSESSIPNINTKGTYIRTPGGTTTAIPLTQASQSTLTFSGLSSGASYNVAFTFTDSTGFTTSNVTSSYTIGPNMPSVFCNKYGLGIGGAKADASTQFKVAGSGYFTGGLSVAGNEVVSGNINANSLGINTDIVNNGTLTTGGTINANGQMVIRMSSTEEDSRIMRVDRSNNTTLAFMDSEVNGIGLALHLYNRDGAWNSSFRFLQGGEFHAPKNNAGIYNFDRYADWNSSGVSDNGGGAGLCNDNGAYKSLMILGNNSAGGSRRINMWDVVNVYGQLMVGDTQVVQSGSNANGQWTKYYDGTLICKQVYYYSSFNCTIQHGSVYYGSSNGWIFPYEFNSAPVVTITIENGGAARFANATITSKSGFNAMVNCAVSHGGGFYFHYVAVGRWKV